MSLPEARAGVLAKVLIRAVMVGAWMAAAGPLAPVQPAIAQNPSDRTIQGKVFAANGSLQSGAIVYLKDVKSLEIKTYISKEDGEFRFGQLGSQTDYQVWAEFGGHKTKVKMISSFDSKKVFLLSLHLEEK